ncbi:hypothetical protein [Lysobacter sp. HA18]
MNRDLFLLAWLAKSAWILRHDPTVDRYFDDDLTLDRYFDADEEPRWDRIREVRDLVKRHGQALGREAAALYAYAETRAVMERVGAGGPSGGDVANRATSTHTGRLPAQLIKSNGTG